MPSRKCILNSMSKTFWAIIAVIIVLFGGILFFRGDDANAPSSSNSNAEPTKHTAGNGTSGVTLVEYADFQCPFCAQYYPLVKEVKQKYNDQITFQFRHLPLVSIHQNAFAAARAAEAADAQGKFWEMHDALYERQGEWSTSSKSLNIFSGYAQQLGLDVDKFKQDFASTKANDAVNADIREFDKTKQAKSTPTFFLEGKKITPKSVEEFSKLIDEAIAAKNKQ